MEDRGKSNGLNTSTVDGDTLLERYGEYLENEEMSDEQAKQFLGALWQIMVAFADLGFSVRDGDKFHAGSDIGMDDVLNYICLEDTAPETVASSKNQNKKEPR
ncbi:hypothetical protein [Palleronia pelagia]|uniref:Uncharacterized protein n=1 Tax=Palleronia pelagia TaxID=387096 RepID=A0A1H8C207_9RHOB|nr:hypothetical protein [Palleronia pelagia]SEM88889.1 hypothetical protein SAMN04488011_101826 [Palleronia pelagia]